LGTAVVDTTAEGQSKVGMLSSSEVVVALRQRIDSQFVFSLDGIVLRIGDYLALKPQDLLHVGVACRAIHVSGVAQSSGLWQKMLRFWYPRASLENPAVVAQAKEDRSRREREGAEILQRLFNTLGCDSPVSFVDLCRAASLPNSGGGPNPKELLQLLARHSDKVRQTCRNGTASTTLFCLQPEHSDEPWEAVNPFQDADALCESADLVELRQATGMVRASAEVAQDHAPHTRELDPRAAFRLFHTGLLTENLSNDRSLKGGHGRTRGKPLRSWEYLTESDLRGVRPAGELLHDGERAIRAVRKSDPASIHALVLERLDGVVYHISGCYNRRVQVLTSALQGGQLCLEREKRKQLERKLLEFMEKVRKERAFGYYFCHTCSSRWRSGFTYEEIGQECHKCGRAVKPYRVTELDGTTAAAISPVTASRVSLGAQNLLRPTDSVMVDDGIVQPADDAAAARVKEKFCRVRVPLGGRNASEGVTFFALVEQDLQTLANKFGLVEACIAQGPGKVAWQANLAGTCSKVLWSAARAELDELLLHHGLCATEEQFVDRHESHVWQQLGYTASCQSRWDWSDVAKGVRWHQDCGPSLSSNACGWRGWQEGSWQQGSWQQGSYKAVGQQQVCGDDVDPPWPTMNNFPFDAYSEHCGDSGGGLAATAAQGRSSAWGGGLRSKRKQGLAYAEWLKQGWWG